MLSKRARFCLGLIAVLSLLSLASSCGGPKTEEDAGGPAAKTFKPKGNEGSVTGKVSYNGTAPEPKKIDTSADAACTAKSPNLTAEDWVVKDGKVANSFVYIKDGTLADGSKIGDWSFEASKTPVTLDQNGCHYKPHVLGVMVKQEITITDSDATTHNIHFTPKNNPDWNQQQANGAAPLKHQLNVAEVLVPVKCNQHPWMKAYIGVLKHPFFAVSGDDGSFTIKGVPPGSYTVAAWHEGGAQGTEKINQVKLAANGSAKVDFAFGEAASATARTGLEMMPALDVPMLGRH